MRCQQGSCSKEATVLDLHTLGLIAEGGVAAFTAAELVSKGKRQVGPFLKYGVANSLAYLTVDERIMRLQKSELGRVSARKLKELLSSRKRASCFDHLLAVQGVFFSSALFSYGWWQRKDPSLAIPIPRNVEDTNKKN